MSDSTPQVNPTRKSLIFETISGDPAAWERFSRAYRPLLYSYAAHRARTMGLSWSDSDVEDVVQDIFVKLLQAMPNLAYDPTRRFRSYLSQCTSNAIRDKLRKTGPVLGEEIEFPGGDEGEDDPDVVLRYFLATLGSVLPEIRSKCLARGNENQWRCFIEAGLKGRPAAEVGSELRISKELVWKNTSRIVMDVHKICLEQYEADFGGEGLHETLARQGPGVLSGLCAEVLRDSSWLDPSAPRPLEYFRALLRDQLPGLRDRTMARAPKAWAAFEQSLRDREEGEAPPVTEPAAATILEEVDRLCRRRSEEDLGDSNLYHELRRMGPDILADLCVGVLKEGPGHDDLPG